MQLAFCSVCLHRHSLDDMLRHVDGAMYEAKRQNGEPGIAVATSL